MVNKNSNPASGINWQDHLYNPKLMARFEMLAAKRFGGESSLAEEAYTEAISRLADPKWQQNKLQGYKGIASPSSFLTAIYKTLLEDFSRKKFGRPRPPAWLQRLGNLWVRVFKMLCLERHEPETIVDRLCHEKGETRQYTVFEAIETIKERIPSCGQIVGGWFTRMISKSPRRPAVYNGQNIRCADC